MNTRLASHQKRLSLIGRNPVFQAIARSPMKQSTQSTQSIDARLSFDAIAKGCGDHYDYCTMDSLTRLVHTLALAHCSDDDQQTAMEAKAAVKRAQVRFADGKAWNFDAPGRIAVMAAMDMFEQMAQTLGRGAITMALIEVMEKREMQ